MNSISTHLCRKHANFIFDSFNVHWGERMFKLLQRNLREKFEVERIMGGE